MELIIVLVVGVVLQQLLCTLIHLIILLLCVIDLHDVIGCYLLVATKLLNGEKFSQCLWVILLAVIGVARVIGSLQRISGLFVLNTQHAWQRSLIIFLLQVSITQVEIVHGLGFACEIVDLYLAECLDGVFIFLFLGIKHTLHRSYLVGVSGIRIVIKILFEVRLGNRQALFKLLLNINKSLLIVLGYHIGQPQECGCYDTNNSFHLLYNYLLLRLRFLRCNSRWRLRLMAWMTNTTTISASTTRMKITNPMLRLSPFTRDHIANMSSVLSPQSCINAQRSMTVWSG